MPRNDGRQRRDQLRNLRFKRKFISSAESSVLVETGKTRVLCVATVEERVPHFLRGSGGGWITAEYGMLPRSSPSRIQRESVKGRLKGRTQEIQRLIGRSLRAAVDLEKIGERTILVDCDVIEADGGTRTASINGGFVALVTALKGLGIAGEAVKTFVGAVSAGVCGGKPMLDLDYSEDFEAAVDMNVVMDENGRYIEIQGTAEEDPFSEEEMASMLKMAGKGIRKIIEIEKKSLRWR